MVCLEAHSMPIGSMKDRVMDREDRKRREAAARDAAVGVVCYPCYRED